MGGGIFDLPKSLDLQQLSCFRPFGLDVKILNCTEKKYGNIDIHFCSSFCDIFTYNSPVPDKRPLLSHLGKGIPNVLAEMYVICEMLTICSLYIHCIFTIYRYIFTVCSLYVHYMLTICLR